MKENRKNLRIFLFIFLLFWGIFIFDSIEVFAAKDVNHTEVVDKTMNDSIKAAVSENVSWLPTASLGNDDFTNGGEGDKELGLFTWTDVRKNAF